MFKAINPATGELIREFPEHDEDEVRRRLERAEEAFQSWRRFDFAERAGHLTAVADLLRERSADFARLMTEEMGKTLAAAESEVDKCAWVCDFYAENAARFLAPEPVATDAAKSFVRYDPLGPVLAIMPWNFPFWQFFRFAAPALMAGNVALLKHAANVPGSALAIEAVFREAGLPEGVVTTLLVSSARTKYLIRDPAVRAVTLTGSDRAGMEVAVRGRALPQEDGAGAGRLRSVHRPRRRRSRRGGEAGGEGAHDQQRPELHRGQALHRRGGDRRPLRGGVRPRHGRAQGGRSDGPRDRRRPDGARGSARIARRPGEAHGRGRRRRCGPAASGWRGRGGSTRRPC